MRHGEAREVKARVGLLLCRVRRKRRADATRMPLRPCRRGARCPGRSSVSDVWNVAPRTASRAWAEITNGLPELWPCRCSRAPSTAQARQLTAGDFVVIPPPWL